MFFTGKLIVTDQIYLKSGKNKIKFLMTTIDTSGRANCRKPKFTSLMSLRVPLWHLSRYRKPNDILAATHVFLINFFPWK
jgi:hypothetical protein